MSAAARAYPRAPCERSLDTRNRARQQHTSIGYRIEIDPLLHDPTNLRAAAKPSRQRRFEAESNADRCAETGRQTPRPETVGDIRNAAACRWRSVTNLHRRMPPSTATFPLAQGFYQVPWEGSTPPADRPQEKNTSHLVRPRGRVVREVKVLLRVNALAR